MLITAVAFLLSMTGVIWLYAIWRRRAFTLGTFRGLQVIAAWFLIAVAGWCWIHAYGAEFGVSYTLIVLALQAWLVITLTYKRKRLSQSAANQTQPPQRHTSLAFAYGARALPKQLLIALVAIPLAGLAAMLVTVVSTMLLPWENVNLIALGIYTMPIVWGAAAYWACADSKLWRPAISLILISLLTGGLIYL